MKRLITSVLILLLTCSSLCNAQSYDERNLIGEWNLTKITGKLPLGINSFKAVSFGEELYREYYDDSNEYYDAYASGIFRNLNSYDVEDREYQERDCLLSDFSICNTDKLHITLDGERTLRFVIIKLTISEMLLQTYDQSCELELKKNASSAPLKVIKKGDVNEDGSIDISDIVNVINIIASGDEE